MQVSIHPPWSTATSTTTVPASIKAKSAFLIKCGAFAPCNNTAPITKSTVGNFSCIAIKVEYCVTTFAGITSDKYLSLVKFVSIIVTWAPKPAAILAACVPTIPPPIIKTSAGFTPGTPPNNFPFPPNGLPK